MQSLKCVRQEIELFFAHCIYNDRDYKAFTLLLLFGLGRVASNNPITVRDGNSLPKC